MPPTRPVGEAESIGSLWSRLCALAGDFALLAALDLRQSLHRALAVTCAAVFGAVLVSTAWLAFVASMVGWLQDAEAAWPTALLVAAASNLLLAVALGVWTVRKLDALPFAATLRQIRGEAPAETEP